MKPIIGVSSTTSALRATPPNLVDWNRRIGTSYSSSDIGIGPLDGFRALVVLTDITHEFATEIGGGGEDAARDHIAFNLAKPEFDLIEPGGIGGGEMHLDARVIV